MNTHSTSFERHRSKLYGIAYRMLGSFSDAEDVVQDAYLRWRDVNLRSVESPAAYLTSIVSRLCIDKQRRARVDRLLYTGPWLPEPVNEEVSTLLTEPEASRSRAEDISLAFLHLLQTLLPLERAVFILKEAFDLSHDQVADTLGIRVAHSRQLLRRARNKMKSNPVELTEAEEITSLMEQFINAATTGDLRGLNELMAEDIVAYSDGGGRVSAALIPLAGKDRVSTVLIHLLNNQAEPLDLTWEVLNGQPCLVMRDSRGVHSTHTVTVQEGRIHRIYTMRNPDKLHHV